MAGQAEARTSEERGGKAHGGKEARRKHWRGEALVNIAMAQLVPASKAKAWLARLGWQGGGIVSSAGQSGGIAWQWSAKQWHILAGKALAWRSFDEQGGGMAERNNATRRRSEALNSIAAAKRNAEQQSSGVDVVSLTWQSNGVAESA